MSLSYLKNHMGMTLTDEQMQDIPNPKLELVVHVTIKFVQAFTLLGTCAAGPMAAVLRRSSRNLAGIQAKAYKYGSRGAVLGVPVGVAATMAKMNTIEDPEAIVDRCYRLRHNVGQVRVDRWTGGAAVLGAGASSVMGAGLVPGYCLGVSGAILASCLYTNVLSKPKAELKE